MDDTRRRIQALETELGIIDRESAVGVEHTLRRVDLLGRLDDDRDVLKKLEDHWNAEKQVVDKILELRSKLRGGAAPVEGTGSRTESAAADAKKSAGAEAKQPELTEGERAKVLAELKTLQTSSPRCRANPRSSSTSVDTNAIAAVVADWTGIPVGRMVKNEVESVLKLADNPQQAHHRPAPRAGRHLQAHPDQPRRPRQPQQAHRRLHARRHLRRRQD